MVLEDVKAVIGTTLQLKDRATTFGMETGLFGSIPEFDSMAVVSVIAALEDRFGIAIEDEEITAETFATIGSLTRFIERKLEH